MEKICRRSHGVDLPEEYTIRPFIGAYRGDGMILSRQQGQHFAMCGLELHEAA